jgi:hypothetical protein
MELDPPTLLIPLTTTTTSEMVGQSGPLGEPAIRPSAGAGVPQELICPLALPNGIEFYRFNLRELVCSWRCQVPLAPLGLPGGGPC